MAEQTVPQGELIAASRELPLTDMKKASLVLGASLVLAFSTLALAAQTGVALSSGSSIIVQSPRGSEIIFGGKLNVRFAFDESKWTVSSLYTNFVSVDCVIDGSVCITLPAPLDSLSNSVFLSGLRGNAQTRNQSSSYDFSIRPS